MRGLFVLIALSGLSTALADELQFDITGEAYQNPVSDTTLLGPAQIIFTVDSQSGELQTIAPSTMTGGIPIIFASNMTVTGFNEVINGQSVLTASSLTLNLSAMGNTDFALEIPGVFEWYNIGVASSEQVSAASASTDVIAALFSSYSPKAGTLELGSGNVTVDPKETTIRAVGVPEPGLFWLMALALLAATSVHLVRQRSHV